MASAALRHGAIGLVQRLAGRCPGEGAAWSGVVRLLLVSLCVLLAGNGLARPADPLRAVADRNGEVQASIAETERAREEPEKALADLRRQRTELEQQMRWVERRASVQALGPEFAQTLRDYLRDLPSAEQAAAGRERRMELLASASDAELAVERALHRIEDLDATSEKLLAEMQPAISDEERADALRALAAALRQQRELLQRLAAEQHELRQRLNESGEVADALLAEADAARQKLTELLFWTPAPSSARTLAELAPALRWTFSAGNWQQAGQLMQAEIARQPLWPVVTVLTAGMLLALRGRLRRLLHALAPAASPDDGYKLRHALTALVVTCLLALPLPLLMWTAASPLLGAAESQQFSAALGHALLVVGRLLLALLITARLLDPIGVAVRHFGWDADLVAATARGLRPLTSVLVVLMLIAAMNGTAHAPFANEESLARVALALGALAVAVLFLHLLRSGSALMHRWREVAPRSWAVRLRPLWLLGFVGVPCAVAALALAGYVVAAGYVFGRLVHSFFFVLLAVILYGLMALWVQMQRRRLARERAVAAGGEGTPPVATAPEAVASPAGGLQRPGVDIAALGEETRSLLDFVVTLLLVGALWWVWRDAVATLGAITDHRLWSHTETVAGKELTHSVTVGQLLLAIVVLLITGVVVRRIGSLLDIVLLQRLDMQADATYAINVMTRYALAASGLVVASRLLGVGWDDVQWLVAALGVGLGFGLQEIVANFVSGLIVLAERPIRIGDVVTVGDVSGKVARIRARATAVIDFDNKEVIIPNKAFITSHVVNWTLSNQIIRLLIKVGVAYGSDIALVQRLILDVVQGNPDVLRDPAPSVFLVAFGDSSLDFEIRAFVGALDRRMRVQHEINQGISRALAERGIDIPFPQRDLNIRSLPQGFAAAVRAAAKGGQEER
ncbi:mechanosensitive ion channel domain-containing protein [Accumulibacter sp.]|uniref:mechanosensitive ion channel domain-containing protein n=1 Tax=Accumulibacter sp. TaxID=2053492 RepID=UPI0025D81234|nr:mechanosensitive ion channel domain-containing protein [Accumulibacter sp.]MCM8613018.1 mechanosensitive ion channel [Accumulibacter sp.]MCM8637059.1 mechanosensitive ion channel [Accumulibacter sp.]MCM8640662.1 mechanosensitive ion channel [Accumulibacter sp.]